MSQIKIVMIDDNQMICDFIKLKLENTGKFIVNYSCDGNEACRMITKEMPDIVLLDINMPNIDGPDVATIIRESPAIKHIPILYLSSLITRDDVIRNQGVIKNRNVASKSMTIDEIITRIMEIVEK
ncbi:MAG: response regulator [bacterium]